MIPRKTRPISTFRPGLQTLEDRVTPVTYTWTGAGLTDFWSEAANWNTNIAPVVGQADIIVQFITPTNSILNYAGLTIDQIRFAAGSDVDLTLQSDLTLNAEAGPFEIDDDTGLNRILGTGNLVLAGSASSGISVNTGNLTLAVDVTGSQGLAKYGAGTLTLTTTNANTYTGTTSIVAGILALNTSTANQGLSDDIVVGDGSGSADSAILQLNTSDEEIPNSAAIAVQSDGQVVFAANRVEEFHTLTLNGGSVNLGGGSVAEVNTGGAVTSVNSGSVIGGTGELRLEGGAYLFNIANGTGALDLDIRCSISQVSAASVTKTGAGTLRISGLGVTTYTGVTQVNEGTLELARSLNFTAIAGPLVIGDGVGVNPVDTVQLLGANQIANSTAVSVNKGALVMGGFSDTIGSLQVSNLGGVYTEGGTLTLGGSLTLNNGQISAAGGGAIRLAGTVNTTGTSNEILGTLDLNGATRTVSVGAGILLIDGAIAGASSGITKTGTGTLRMMGAANTYTGPTTLNEGSLELAKTGPAIPGPLVIGDGIGIDTVQLQASNQIGNTSDVQLNSSGLLNLTGYSDTIGTLTVFSGEVNIGIGVLSLGGALALKGGQITSTGAGSLVLGGNVGTQAHTGPATIAGSVHLNGAARTFNVADGPATNDLVLSGPVGGPNQGSGTAFIKSGAGTVQLGTNWVYLGTTSLTSGVMDVQGILAGPVSQSGGTLGGSGFVQNLTPTGGLVSPGLGSATAPVALRTNALAFGTLTYTPHLSGSFGGATDQIRVTGGVDLTGATLLPIRVGASAAGHSFILIDNLGVDAIVGTFVGLPEGSTTTIGGQSFRVSYVGGDGNDVVLKHITDPHAVANFGTTTYRWSPAGWQLLRNQAASELDIADDGTVWGVYVDGVRRFPAAGGDTLTTAGIPESIELTDGGVAFGDFGGNGLFVFNGTNWQSISPHNPTVMDAADDGSVFAYLDNALRRWRSDLGWQVLSGNVPASLKASGNGSVYGVFPNGVWRWQGGTWTSVTGAIPQNYEVTDTGVFVGDFGADGGPDGVWRWNLATGWTGLTGADPSTMQVSPTGSVYGNFLPGSGANGLWRREAETGTWTQVHSQLPVAAAVGLDGSCFANFGSYAPGIWRYTPTLGWVQLSPATPTLLTTRR